MKIHEMKIGTLKNHIRLNRIGLQIESTKIRYIHT